jgi:hypothetical protein
VKGPEIVGLPPSHNMAGMSTFDYWIYSAGLVALTIAVIVA